MDTTKKTEKSTFRKLKTGFGRKRQELMSRVGKAEQTVDEQFNHLKTRLEGQEAKVKKLNVDVRRYLDALKATNAAAIALAEDLANFYEDGAALQRVAKEHLEAIKRIEAERAKMEAVINSHFVSGIEAYCQQFPILRKRIHEREKRRIDADRYMRDVKILAEKPTAASEDKLIRTEQKLKVARQGYQALNDELLKDIPALLGDRMNLLDHLFTLVLQQEYKYYSALPGFLTEQLAKTKHIDTSKLLNYPPSITPNEKSAFSNYVKPSTIAVKKEEAESEPKVKFSGVEEKVFEREDDEEVGYSDGEDEEGEVFEDDDATTVPKAEPQTQYDKPPAKEAPSLPPKESVKPTKVLAKALYDFDAADETELSFKEGDTLTLLKKKGEWYLAELGYKQGLVPGPYIEILPTT